MKFWAYFLSDLFNRTIGNSQSIHQADVTKEMAEERFAPVSVLKLSLFVILRYGEPFLNI